MGTSTKTRHHTHLEQSTNRHTTFNNPACSHQKPFSLGDNLRQFLLLIFIYSCGGEQRAHDGTKHASCGRFSVRQLPPTQRTSLTRWSKRFARFKIVAFKQVHVDSNSKIDAQATSRSQWLKRSY